MARWGRGAGTIEKLIRERRFDRVSGDAADGRAWLTLAAETLADAETTLTRGGAPRTASITAYDAARSAMTALFIQQGLRPTSTGGHYVLVEAARAQFGDVFTGFDALRRRRNEVEYRYDQPP